MNYHVIDHWQTAASEYPRRSVGEWSVSSRHQGEGVYRMQDPGAFYYTPTGIELTVLKEGERVWFTDEPRQLYALAEIGLFRARGHVIVGGLGLGLIQHFLARNDNVASVLTIERAPELQELVWPHIWQPYSTFGKLVIADFYEELPRLAAAGYWADTIITDFIFGYQDDKAWEELQRQRDFCREHYPKAQFLEHGYQRRMDAEVVGAVLPPSPLLSEGIAFDQVKVFR